jgi:late competence protein required for DNA uptake (superfamily II DNA/RNA helicase)
MEMKMDVFDEVLQLLDENYHNLVAPSGSYGVNGFVGIDWGTGLSQSVRIQVIRCNHCGQKNYVNFDKLPSVAVIVCQSCGGDLL